VLLLAHAGHWAIWVLYSVPVLIVLASIVISFVRDRGGEGDGARDREADDTDSQPRSEPG
jgi:hypothetical protein